MIFMNRKRTVVVLLLVAASVIGRAADYFPPRGEWARKPPAELGFDGVKLQQAVEFSIANENPLSKDMAEMLKATFGKNEPDYKIIGPTQTRAALNGLIIRHGYVAAEWGDTNRADMTHSVTKTFLTTVTGQIGRASCRERV